MRGTIVKNAVYNYCIRDTIAVNAKTGRKFDVDGVNNYRK